MKEYVLIFRSNGHPHERPTPDQMQERMNWMGSVAARNKLVDKGQRLSAGPAKTLKGKEVTEGPYAEGPDFVNGYMVVKAADINEAVAIAGDNPILRMGGSIEVREAVPAPAHPAEPKQ